jgi:hypothetical protein
MAVPLFSAVGMFDRWTLFAMPLSIAVPAFAKRGFIHRRPSPSHRRAVVAVELAVATPGLGARGAVAGMAKVSDWPGRIRAAARTGLYSLALPEPPCRSLGPCG